MTHIISMALETTRQTVTTTSLPDLAREQRLGNYQRQLGDVDNLEQAISHMGGDLRGLSAQGNLALKRLKPLQAQARIASSLIRNQMYLMEIRKQLETAAWSEMENKSVQPKQNASTRPQKRDRAPGGQPARSEAPLRAARQKIINKSGQQGSNLNLQKRASALRVKKGRVDCA